MTASVLPPLGSPIMFEIDLPRFGTNDVEISRVCFDQPELPHQSFLLLAAEGLVLRHHVAGIGFAATMTQISFVHQDERKFA